MTDNSANRMAFGGARNATRKTKGLVAAIAQRSLVRRMLRPVVAFAAIVTAGVVGFSMLGGVGIIDALFWLLDPTSIELHFQEHDGSDDLVKAYAIAILTSLVVTGLWTGETLLSAVFGGRILEEVNRLGTRREVDELQNHVVVCGYGTFGKTIATQIQESGDPVVIVERKKVQYMQAIEDGMLAIQGDARQGETLQNAGIERAATVVGAIDDTNTNVKIAVTVNQLSSTVQVIVRAGNQMDEAVARRVGADEVIVPEVVSAEQVFANL